jgi:hypothetical protein
MTSDSWIIGIGSPRFRLDQTIQYFESSEFGIDRQFPLGFIGYIERLKFTLTRVASLSSESTYRYLGAKTRVFCSVFEASSSICCIF